MTLEKAKKISTDVIGIFSQKPPDSLWRRSQFHGYSNLDIYHAFALMLAFRRQMGFYDSALQIECRKSADVVTALMRSLRFVVSDEKIEKLYQFPPQSNQFKETKGKLIGEQLRECDSNPEWQIISKKENFDVFNGFCWSLDAEDILYWQKVYSHLDLPYDQDSPKGMPDLTFDDNTCESWVVPKNTQQQKDNTVKIFLLIVGVIAAIWFLVKH